MGKVFTLATDNPFLYEQSDNENVYSLEETEDDTNYTYRNKENFVNFGIINPISISDVLQYSFL